MRVGLDLAISTPAHGGIGRYAEQLTRALVQSAGPAEEYLLFPTDPIPPWLQTVTGRPGVTVDARHGGVRNRVLRANLLLGPRLGRLGVDVFHSPDNLSLPLTASRRVRLVATIHDLIPLVLPWTVTRRHRLIWSAVLGRVVARADRLVAVSHATARDLAEYFPQAAAKIRVVHHGVDARFTPAPADAVTAVRERYGLCERYILYAGTIEPKKNLVNLLRAYALLSGPPPLVLAGKRGWLADPVFQQIHRLNLGQAVRVLGFVPDGDLPALLTGAELFVFPSLYEGFGLPPLEAMACGTPVVVGDRSSLPEVVGDAGVLVDPENLEAIAGGMARLLDDPAHRATMAARALAQAGGFRWEVAAAQTRAAYAELA